MGVAGGAVFPPIQGAVADAGTTRISYFVPAVGFVIVLTYVTIHWLRTGRHVLKEKVVVPAAVGDEAYMPDTTVVPSAFGGIVAQPLSKTRTIEEVAVDDKKY
jgi:FHS family L-fucose permease-like MFS transporter